jgi:hypothetical protein
VSAEDGVQLKTQTFDGLTEIPAASGTLAFKLLPGETGEWKLAVATERVESWVRAEVMNTVTLTETLVTGRSQVRYEIQNAPTKEFRVRVPAAFRNVEVTGANIRRKDRDETTGEWRVELQNKVRGNYTLTVTWIMPWNAKDGSLELAGVEAAGVERETGAFALIAPARLRIEQQATTPDLLKVDVRDLPAWAERGGETPVLAYRYLRPGYKLALTAQRFEEAEVLQALVDNVRLTTVVSEDGQMMTEMALAIRNNARQYLEVALPEGAQVWSAFVAGQPVRPSRREGKLLLPMERSSGEAPVAVELTYVGKNAFPRRSGVVDLATPGLDVPLKNARWELFLPPDYAYGEFAGTMKRDVAGATPISSYTIRDYAAQERVKKYARDSEVSQSLDEARKSLSGGKLKQASELVNRMRAAPIADKSELQNLEMDVKRAGAQNIVHAQQAFFERNVSGPAAPAPSMRYDADAAEQQWDKVQAAQELAVAKTLPLRINLPKRGIALAFSQVLQTDVGKPMTVRLVARNERASGWPSRLVWGSVVFLGLWAIATRWLRRSV